MATYSVTLNGVERDCRLSALEIRCALNRIPTMLGEFISETASFRPDEDDDIVITEDTGTSPVEIIFGGIVEAPEESAVDGQVADGIDAISTRVEAVGYASYADRRYVNETLAAGTLKSILQTLVTYLDDYGVTLDPLQETGPSFEDQIITYRKLSDVLNDLSSLSVGSGGSPDIPYVWEIDFEKTLRMYQIGSKTAPVDLIEGDAVEVGDLVIRRTTRGSANRVILRSGNGALTTIANDLAAQGSPPILTEVLVETAADLTQAIATQAAAGLLQQFSLVQKEAKYSTRSFGLQVGQIQTITAAKRNVNSSFLLTEVVTRQDPDALALRRWITAIEGYRLQGSWMDVLSRWTTGVGGVGTVGLPTGSVVNFPGGGVAPSGGDPCSAKCEGTLVFTSFGSEGDWQFLNPLGVNLGAILNPISEDADSVIVLADGTVVIIGTNQGTAFYLPDFSSATYPIDAINIARGYGLDSAENIYGSKAGLGAQQIRKVTRAGVLVTDYSLVSSTMSMFSVAANAAGTKIYFTAADPFTAPLKTTKEIYVYDVGTGVISLFASDATFACSFRSLIVLPTSGDVIACWNGSGLTGDIRRYDSSGALQATYAPTFNGMGFSPESIQSGLTEFTIWAAGGANVNTNSGTVIAEIQLDSGAIVNQFAPDNGTAFYFGGPFAVLRAPIS